MEQRPIDANALKEDLRQYFSDGTLDSVSAKLAFNMVLRKIDNAPTIEIPNKVGEIITAYTKGFDTGVETVRPQGEWNYIQADMCVCPFCGAMPHKLYKNYCAKCGADMRKGEENATDN